MEIGWTAEEVVEKFEGVKDDDWFGPAVLMNDDVVMVVEWVVEAVGGHVLQLTVRIGITGALVVVIITN